MTEAEWKSWNHPQPMLNRLRGTATPRELRLFASACCRRLWDLLIDERSRHAVEVSERYADGLADVTELETAHRGALAATVAVAQLRSVSGGNEGEAAARAYAARAAQHATVPPGVELVRTDGLTGPLQRAIQVHLEAPARAAKDAVSASLRRNGEGFPSEVPETRAQLNLIHCLFGNPFRPASVDPTWLRWNGGAIPQLARAIYEGRMLPTGTLDAGRLALLADMLTDAGCTDPDMLEHLRAGRAHVRGCWVVDALLVKSEPPA
jgi:hypothetical protein